MPGNTWPAGAVLLAWAGASVGLSVSAWSRSSTCLVLTSPNQVYGHICRAGRGERIRGRAADVLILPGPGADRLLQDLARFPLSVCR